MAVSYEHIYNTLHGTDSAGRQHSPNLEVSIAYLPHSGPKFNTPEKLVSYLKRAKTQKVPEGMNAAGAWMRQAVSRVDLEGQDISGAHLPNGLFQFTLMKQTQMDGLVFSSGEFRHSYMAGASLKNAQLEETQFTLCDLEGADFTGANLAGSRFEQPALKGAAFTNATLDGVDFSGQDLRGADFTGASMKNMNLRGADLRGAVFDNADMQGVDLSYARVDLKQLQNLAVKPSVGPAGRFGARRMQRLRNPSPRL